VEQQCGKLKVATVFGTRPEIIRLCRIFDQLDRHVNHVMIHTGQSYDFEMNRIFFDELGIRKPDHFLEVKSDTLGGQIAKVIERSEAVFIKERPDAILILGDTNSALAAIVAKRMYIPIFHMEAGNRCFDERVPEEINRRIVDHISDINLPYSENARMNLLREGIHPSTIYVTGSPLAEIMRHYQDSIEACGVLEELKLTPRGYFVVSIHREENVDDEASLRMLSAALQRVADVHQKPLLMSLHPRTAQRLESMQVKLPGAIVPHKPFGYFAYMKLQQNAFAVLSDSGTIVEEAALMGIPAIQLRRSSERPEGYDEGVTILSGLDRDSVLAALAVVIQEFESGTRFKVPVSYQADNVSSKVLRFIVGLTGIVKEKRRHGVATT